MLVPGQSKHASKKEKATQNKIFSYETRKTYVKQAKYFVLWCKEKHGCKFLDECWPYAREYFSELAGSDLSAWTIKTRLSAITKLSGLSAKDLGVSGIIPARKRADVKRSRGEKPSDKNFSEKRNAELVAFCRSTGLRRHELANLRGTDLILDGSGIYVHVRKGKGGRNRMVPVIGDQKNVLDLMQKAGKGKVFDRIPVHADIHGYRSDYACTFYRMYARPIEEISSDELYVCRADQKGKKYDKLAMQKTSEALGHGRIDVIAQSYLRD